MANKFRYQKFLLKGLNVIRDDPIYSTDRSLLLRSIRCFQLIALEAHRNPTLYYSQFGQDVLVSHLIFPDLRSGFFVDCGARCGTINSNTRMLEERRGWDGILLEPNRSSFAQAAESRLAECVHAAVSREEGSMLFLDVRKEPGNSRLIRSSELERFADQEDYDIYEVPVLRLADILYSRGIEHVDYLDIDVEGEEVNVLAGIDFGAVRFEVIAAESPPARYEAIRGVLEGQGFLPYCRVGVDTFFLPKERFADLDRRLGLHQIEGF